MANCKIEQCARRSYVRGYCVKHYQRWLRHGDPNRVKFRQSKRGAALKWLNAMLDNPPEEECVVWPYNIDPDGRGRMYYKGKASQLVSRVICEILNGPPPTEAHQAAHSCGRGHLGCVNPNHIRWATAKENHADKKKHGTDFAGENNPAAKLTEKMVLQIKCSTEKNVILAQKHNVDPSTISDIKRGKLWGHL